MDYHWLSCTRVLSYVVMLKCFFLFDLVYSFTFKPMQTLQVISTPTDPMTLTNFVYVAPSKAVYNLKSIEINGFIFLIHEDVLVKPGCIALNARQRSSTQARLGDTVTVRIVNVCNLPQLSCIKLEVDVASKLSTPSQIKIDATAFSSNIFSVLSGQVFTCGQQIVSSYGDRKIVLCVRSIETLTSDKGTTKEPHGVLSQETLILFTRTQSPVIQLLNLPYELDAPTNTLFPEGFNFSSTGIGGLGKQIEEIFRRAFESRLYPKSIIRKLKIRHVKGILLHGPPGCGKTLIAKRLSAMLGCENLTIVNGPELFDKYIGQTEANIRNLFAAAQAEQRSLGDDSPLHIIVFDEFDSMVKHRGSTRDNTGVNDSAVNQLLAKMDGPEELNNILLIAMTNRKDLIDEAVLRPGRFEVHILVTIPDQEGRLEILQIQTKNMRANGLLDADVDFHEMAVRTENYTGAELEGIVNNAVSFATHRHIDPSNPTKFHNPETLSIQKSDFNRAIECSKPMLGVASDLLDYLTRNGIYPYGPAWDELTSFCASYIETLRNSARISMVSMLLHGEAGTGKAGLAAHVTRLSGFPFVKVIHPSLYIGMSDLAKCNAIREVFEDADRSPLSIVILCDIERLIEYVHLGMRFSNSVLQTILVKLKHQPSPGNKLLLLGTSSNFRLLHELELAQAFHAAREVEPLGHAEQKIFLEKMGVDFISQEEETLAFTDILPEQIPVKKFMLIVERALSVEEEDVHQALLTANGIRIALE